MERYAPHLRWIDSRAARMLDLVSAWSSIPTGSYHVAGLNACAQAIAAEASLLSDVEFMSLPPHRQIGPGAKVTSEPLGQLIRLARRPSAPRQVLLCIHYDTVYGAQVPDGAVCLDGANHLRGPGVTDAKGGLVVLLTALQALERSPVAPAIGWEVLLNPDEEIGSPGSAALLKDAASRHDFGLLFEPALEDGALVSARKGSGNFTAVVRGRSAHAGRNPQAGRNAIAALAEFINAVTALNGCLPGVTVNVAHIEGGGALNVVPDLAIARFNVRVATSGEQQQVEKELRKIAAASGSRDGISVELEGGFHAPPKELNGSTESLLQAIAGCGRDLNLPISWRPTGGACDGNKLAAAGLPNVDSLGVRGGLIHSPEEFLQIDSLVERAKLCALLLMKVASGEVEMPRRQIAKAGEAEGTLCS